VAQDTTTLQAADTVLDRAAGGEDDHRDAPAGPGGMQHLGTVHVGQAEVEQD
jgi:hypothetical protein